MKGPIDVWGEDENYPRSHWKYEVAEGYTNLGYWDWVDHQKEAEDSVEPKYPDICVMIDLHGPAGNAYAVLGIVSKELKANGVSKEEVQEFLDDARSADYDHLLDVCRQWVDFPNEL